MIYVQSRHTIYSGMGPLQYNGQYKNVHCTLFNVHTSLTTHNVRNTLYLFILYDVLQLVHVFFIKYNYFRY